MDLYTFSLALGGAGLGVMGAIGLGHLAGGAHGADHGHGANTGGHAAPHGHAHGHAHGPAGHGGAHGSAHGHGAAHHAHGAPGHAGHHGSAASPTETHFGDLASRLAWSLLSPRVVFSFLIGFGAAGLLLGHVGWLPAIARLPLALAGGIAFEHALVAPLWNLLFSFASRPASTLEQVLFDEVPAVSGFDARGQGMVALELDGQVVQVLATLCAGDRAAGVRVRAGDRVRVEEVDLARQRCVVTRVG